MPYATMLVILPLLEEDLRVSLAWWRNARAGAQDPNLKSGPGLKGHAHMAAKLWRRDLRALLAWMQSHNMFVKMAGWAMAIVASLMLLEFRRWPMDDPR